MMGDRGQRYGVVHLEQIKGLCPLAPIIEGKCTTWKHGANAFALYNKYMVNPYSSHQNYRRYRSHVQLSR